MQFSLRYSVVPVAAALILSSLAASAQNKKSVPDDEKKGTPQYDPGAFQRSDPGPGGPAPVHDLWGTWTGPEEPALNNKIPQMTAAGQAALKKNIPDPFSATSNDPWKVCDPFGMPRVINNQNGMVGFAQMPDRIIMIEAFEKVWREVWTDGRQAPKNIGHKGGPSTMYYGYSTGHWDGDHTLVVETVGMDESTWVDRRGYPHSVDAKAIERYTRVDHNHLTFTETIDDPTYYKEPFVMAKGEYRFVQGQEDVNAPIPFAAEHLCVTSDALQYLQLLADPADEDSATGNAKKK